MEARSLSQASGFFFRFPPALFLLFSKEARPMMQKRVGRSQLFLISVRK